MARHITERRWAKTDKEAGFKNFLRYFQTGFPQGAQLKVEFKSPISCYVHVSGSIGQKQIEIVDAYSESHEYYPFWKVHDKFGNEYSTSENIERWLHSTWLGYDKRREGPFKNGYSYDFSNILTMSLFRTFPLKCSNLWERI
jgi:hypothetical protein